MGTTLREVLGVRQMIGMIESVKSGLPNVLPDSFMALRDSTIGDDGSYFVYEGAKNLVPGVDYGGEAKTLPLKAIAERRVKLWHSNTKQRHKPHVMMNLMSDDGALQRLGAQEIARQALLHKTRIENMRIAMMHSMLFTGQIYFDSDYNLLPSSSGALTARTIDYSVPAGHKNQLDVFGAGAIIDASWATTSTDIIGHIRAIKSAAVRKTGYPIAYCFYGDNIPSYLAKNTSVGNQIRGDSALASRLNAGEVGNFMGIQWVPAGDAHFADASGSLQQWVGEDDAIFTPAPDSSWLATLEGTYPIPSNTGVIFDEATAAVADMVVANGMFAYAKQVDNTIEQYGGDTCLPVLKVPTAVYQAHTTP